MFIPLTFPDSKDGQISPSPNVLHDLGPLGLQGPLKVISSIPLPPDKPIGSPINLIKCLVVKGSSREGSRPTAILYCREVLFDTKFQFLRLSRLFHFCLWMTELFLTNVIPFSSTRQSVDIIVYCYSNSMMSQQTLKGRG